ncbi:MAG TPA: acetyl-CoA acetyltransferase [Acidimicrobiales bacterium]|nr:acetyl-CoA acetyltransferase [Acidimicrobiales bacterium]
MALDPRTPVLVGVGQHQRKPQGSVVDLPSPVEMMEEACRLAGTDSGSGDRLLREAQSVQVVDTMSWRVTNPAAVLARHIGASPKETVSTAVGGNTPQTLVNESALAILRGDVDVVVIAGVEAMYTRNRARKLDEKLRWGGPDESEGLPEPTRRVGSDKPGTSEFEMARGLMMPTQVYPIFECAIRAANGQGVHEHTMRIAELWSRFSKVAAANPNAWSPEEKSAEEIATPGADNRLVGFPYPKYMNANIQVDQAAALILCSVEAARAAGVPEDRWVFPWSGADAHDHWFLSERDTLAASPAIAAIGRAAFELAGIGIDDIAHLDLYSCFPSALQMGAAALGLDAWDPSRVPTLTGGLTFGGGPGNNYVTHSIAQLAGALRDDPGSVGLVTALGWYATKHAIGIYSTKPPAEGFRWRSAQNEVDASPKRDVATDHVGDANVEAYTVMHDRDGNRLQGLCSLLLDDGRRTLATTSDADLMREMVEGDIVGRRADVDAAGHFSVS